MADPLSISVSILAIAQASKSIIGYLSDLDDAREDRKQLLSEVVNVYCLINLLQVHAQQPETRGAVAERTQWKSGRFETLNHLGQPGGPFKETRRALGKLETKLTPAQGPMEVNRHFLGLTNYHWQLLAADIFA